MTPKEAFETLMDTMNYALERTNMSLDEFVDICEEEIEVLQEYFKEGD